MLVCLVGKKWPAFARKQLLVLNLSSVARQYETCLFGFINKWLILTGRNVKFKASIGKWGVRQVVLISWFTVWLDIICQVEWNWFFSIRCSLRQFFYVKPVFDPQFLLSGHCTCFDFVDLYTKKGLWFFMADLASWEVLVASYYKTKNIF